MSKQTHSPPPSVSRAIISTITEETGTGEQISTRTSSKPPLRPSKRDPFNDDQKAPNI